MSEEFKAITTQEEFDKAIADRLSRQKESILKKYEGFDELQKENESLKTQLGEANKALEESTKDIEGFNSQIEELNGKVGQYELSKMKTTIALQNGIPYDLAGRLQGEDEASILEDAKSLATLIGQKDPVAPLASTEPQGVGGEDSAYKALLENLNLEGE